MGVSLETSLISWCFCVQQNMFTNLLVRMASCRTTFGFRVPFLGGSDPPWSGHRRPLACAGPDAAISVRIAHYGYTAPANNTPLFCVNLCSFQTIGLGKGFVGLCVEPLGYVPQSALRRLSYIYIYIYIYSAFRIHGTHQKYLRSA